MEENDILNDISFEQQIDDIDYLYDLLEKADKAKTKKQKLIYLDEALKIEPENADILVEKAQLVCKTTYDYIEELDKIIEIAANALKKENFFDEYYGEFWGVYETRPYMRARYERMRVCLGLGMIKLAGEECKEMLKLCEGDNLGVRYALMHIYAFFEDEEAALALYDKYQEECGNMLMPLSIIYYKKRDMQTAEKYLKLLEANNKGLKEFLHAFDNEYRLYEILSEMSPYGYRYGTVEELAVEFDAYGFLFRSAIDYFQWAKKAIKRKRTPKK